MNGDDWQAGDLALCVNARVLPWTPKESVPLVGQLRAGAIYFVEGRGASGQRSGPTIFLRELPLRGRCGWTATRFRKINPLTDEERDEFLADLNVPVREGMPLSSAGDAA